MSRLTTQDDIRPGPLSPVRQVTRCAFLLTHRVASVQPTKGPYAGLHTRDQSVRPLAISNLKRGVTMFIHVTFQRCCLYGMYASVAFSDSHALQHESKEGEGLTSPPIT
jgi:hypothetical protein